MRKEHQKQEEELSYPVHTSISWQVSSCLKARKSSPLDVDEEAALNLCFVPHCVSSPSRKELTDSFSGKVRSSGL